MSLKNIFKSVGYLPWVGGGPRSGAESRRDYEAPLFSAAPGKNGLRVRILGDHSTYHCGGAAVMSALTQVARRKGWDIAGPNERYDVLVVNGEGSMHSGSRGFHRKMGVLAAAVHSGVPAYLVNTVWQNNPPDYDAVLKRLSGINVREVCSYREMKDRHGVEPDIVIDASFFAPVSPVADVPGTEGRAIFTDFYVGDRRRGRRWVVDPSVVENGIYLSLKERSWSQAVSMLRPASCLATGRQHAVYAACRARTPFAAMNGNTHKISGLVATSGIDIPVADDLAEVRKLAAHILDYREAFTALFEWMERWDPMLIFPDREDARARLTP